MIALANLEEDNGWAVLATTVPPETCVDTEILQAYQEQNTTVEPGFRWIKNPAAIAPVWLEKPERIAALAMLTVVGLLVYSIIQRQVRLYLHTHDQQVPGNKGATATPTAVVVVLSLFAQVALVQFWIDNQEVAQVYGVQHHHLLLCDALGLDSSCKFISIYGILCLQGEEAPLWPVYGVLTCSPALRSAWIAPACPWTRGSSSSCPWRPRARRLGARGGS